MSEKRFTFDYEVEFEIFDRVTKKHYDGRVGCQEKICDLLNEQQATIEQLRTQLLICQQSKSDDGRFQVWEVPPIPKGMRITTSDGEMMSEKRFRFEKECTENFLTEKGVFYNNERPMGANEIIALLNSLSEENEQLKSRIAFFEKQADEFEQYTAQTIQNMIADYRCGE